jgi:non-ribosomal peptide synthetase component F
LEAYAHQDLPFQVLVEALGAGRQGGHPPLFQVMLQYQNLGAAELDLPGLSVRLRNEYSNLAKFDLTVFVIDRPELLALLLEYNEDLFFESSVREMAEQLRANLERALEEPEGDCLHSQGRAEVEDQALHLFTEDLSMMDGSGTGSR